MPFLRPTRRQIITDAQADLASRVTGADPTLKRRSNLNILATVEGAAVDGLHAHLGFLVKQFFPQTAVDEYLLRHGELVDLTPFLPSPATGSAMIAGNDPSVIPAGTRFQRSDAALFITTADAAIGGGTALLFVVAAIPGIDGNTPGGSILTLVNPLPGIAAQATVQAGLQGGTDAETPDAFADRIVERRANGAKGGNNNDYIRWAKSVAGVTRVWVFRNWQGPGTVGVTFVMDGNAGSILPDAITLALVQSTLTGLQPVCAVPVVFAPTPKPITPIVKGVADPGTQAAINANFAAIAAAAGPGTIGYLNAFSNAVTSLTTNSDAALVYPAADITTQPYELLTVTGAQFQ